MKWYSAEEVRPARSCKVWIISTVFTDKTVPCIDTNYDRKADVFGSEKYQLKCLYWAYAPTVDELGLEYEEEEDEF